MDIIDNLMKAIVIVDEDNKKILSDLLVQKLIEQSNDKSKPPQLTKVELDLQELLNYNGGSIDE